MLFRCTNPPCVAVLLINCCAAVCLFSDQPWRSCFSPACPTNFVGPQRRSRESNDEKGQNRSWVQNQLLWDIRLPSKIPPHPTYVTRARNWQTPFQRFPRETNSTTPALLRSRTAAAQLLLAARCRLLPALLRVQLTDCHRVSMLVTYPAEYSSVFSPLISVGLATFASGASSMLKCIRWE